jgi:hypothetical protein
VTGNSEFENGHQFIDRVQVIMIMILKIVLNEFRTRSESRASAFQVKVQVESARASATLPVRPAAAIMMIIMAVVPVDYRSHHDDEYYLRLGVSD